MPLEFIGKLESLSDQELKDLSDEVSLESKRRIIMKFKDGQFPVPVLTDNVVEDIKTYRATNGTSLMEAHVIVNYYRDRNKGN